MTIYDMAQSWRIFFASLVIGGALGVLYDILRLSRLFLTIPREGRGQLRTALFVQNDGQNVA